MIRENSFKRLNEILNFLIITSKSDFKEVIKIILMWNLSSVLIKPYNDNYLIITNKLNSSQIMMLNDISCRIYYLNENYNFVPWGFKEKKKYDYYKIIDKDFDFLLNLSEFRQYTEFVNFSLNIDKNVEIRPKKEIVMEFRLIEKSENEKKPDDYYLLIDKDNFNNFIRFVKFDNPMFTQNKDLFYFYFIKIENENHILLKFNKDYFKDLNFEEIFNISKKVFIKSEYKNIYIEYNTLITPFYNDIVKNDLNNTIYFIYNEDVRKIKSFYIDYSNELYNSYDFYLVGVDLFPKITKDLFIKW